MSSAPDWQALSFKIGPAQRWKFSSLAGGRGFKSCLRQRPASRGTTKQWKHYQNICSSNPVQNCVHSPSWSWQQLHATSLCLLVSATYLLQVLNWNSTVTSAKLAKILAVAPDLKFCEILSINYWMAVTWQMKLTFYLSEITICSI